MSAPLLVGVLLWDHPLVEEPLNELERTKLANTCRNDIDLSPMTILIDDISDRTCADYAAWPDRLYLVDAKGKIAFAGDPGPRGFDPELLEEAIKEQLAKADEKGKR